MNNSNITSSKVCQYCNDHFVPRRSDAKFCSSKCRNDSNNLKKLEEREAYQAIVGEIHKILWKNRSILLLYVGQIVRLEILNTLGFKINFHTQIKKGDKVTHFGFYDIWCYAEKNGHLKVYRNE